MSSLKNKNLYGILRIDKNSTNIEIKKSYYDLSKQYHPDLNKDKESESIFKDICDAYKILINKESRSDYDLKSKYGKNYNEYFELFDVNIDFSYDQSKEKLETFKRNSILNIQIEIDESFNGTIEYERWIKCKNCDGSGKDLSSKIVVRDNNGNVLKTFDADDGCDFCEGTGKSYNGSDCNFCSGNGKIGLTLCSCCVNGRIIGKQKLKGIKLVGSDTKIESMGHWSRNGIGYLLLTKRSNI
jgi:DnaJ-class molecular chaperone